MTLRHTFLADVQANSKKVLFQALDKVPLCPAAKVNKKFGDQAKQFNTTLQAYQEEAETLSMFLIKQFLPIVNIQYNNRNIESMCTAFHKMSLSLSVQEAFFSVMATCGMGDSSKQHFILQRTLTEIWSILLDKLNTTGEPDETLHQAGTLTVPKEQALRYTAGFILMKLRKRYLRRKPTSCTEAYIALIETLREDPSTTETDSLLDYTRDLVLNADRGGLFRIDDRTFVLFRTMECLVDGVLKKRNIRDISSVNIGKHLNDIIVENTDVQMQWDNISTTLGSDVAKEALLQAIITNWVQLRVKSFCSAYMYVKKKEN